MIATKVEPAAKPRHPLGRAAVGEAVRHNLPAGFALQAIIANGGRCAQGLFQVTRVQQVSFAVGGVAPYAGETVRLQLLSHRQGIDLGLALAGPGLLHLLADTQQGLDVVPDLMGDDIGLGEIAGAP